MMVYDIILWYMMVYYGIGGWEGRGEEEDI